MGILDYSAQNPWLSDALATISQGLLSYGSGNPNALAQLPQYLAERQRYRRDDQRQAKLDERQNQIFQMQMEEQQRTKNQEAAKLQAFQGLLPTLPEGIRPTAQAMGPDFVDLWGKGQIENQFKAQSPQVPTVKDFYEGGKVIQKQWNQQTGAWDVVGQGPRWQPPQDTGKGAEFGLAPFYTTDANGTVHAWQLSKGGGIQEIPVPQGQSVSPQTQYLDTGTSYVPVDKRTAAPTGGAVAKDVAGEATAKEAGKGQGEAIVSLPTVEANADIIKGIISQARSAPGRETATGLSGTLDPRNYIAGTDASNFKAIKEQLGGQAFLQAYNSLRGGGQISEIEGKKAQDALVRLQTSQSDEAFLKALNDFEDEVNKLVDVARTKAQGGSTVNNNLKSKYGLE